MISALFPHARAHTHESDREVIPYPPSGRSDALGGTAELFPPTTVFGMSPALIERERKAAEAVANEERRRRKAEELMWAAARVPIELAGDQIEARIAIMEFIDGDWQHFCLQGFAGTGKTTVLAALARANPEWLLVSPTGKAASVLSRKIGAAASTLHKLLYTPSEEKNGRLAWVKRHQPGDLAGEVVVIDEASMVDVTIARDLLETGVRVIASGDPGQLPPVRDTAFFTTADCTLSQIRRQAAGSPIIINAHRVRAGLDYETDGEAFQVVSKCDVQSLDWADIVLCWRNDTRHTLNRFMRGRRGIGVRRSAATRRTDHLSAKR